MNIFDRKRGGWNVTNFLKCGILSYAMHVMMKIENVNFSASCKVLMSQLKHVPCCTLDLNLLSSPSLCSNVCYYYQYFGSYECGRHTNKLHGSTERRHNNDLQRGCEIK